MRKFFLRTIKFYKSYITVLTPASCRYYPSCSEYALWIFKNENIFLAFFRVFIRILKCNPLFIGGIDYPIIKKNSLKPTFQQKNNFLKVSDIEFWLVPYQRKQFYLIQNQQKG